MPLDRLGAMADVASLGTPRLGERQCGVRGGIVPAAGHEQAGAKRKRVVPSAGRHDIGYGCPTRKLTRTKSEAKGHSQRGNTRLFCFIFVGMAYLVRLLHTLMAHPICFICFTFRPAHMVGVVTVDRPGCRMGGAWSLAVSRLGRYSLVRTLYSGPPTAMSG